MNLRKIKAIGKILLGTFLLLNALPFLILLVIVVSIKPFYRMIKNQRKEVVHVRKENSYKNQR